MDWLSTRGRVCCRGRERGVGGYSEALRRHATQVSLSLFLTCSLSDRAVSPTSFSSRTNPPAQRALARAHAHLSGVARAPLFTRPRTEKQDGDLWDGAGRRHPFNGLPKRLNFVADPLLSAPGDSGRLPGVRPTSGEGAESPGVTAAVNPGFTSSLLASSTLVR